jgi:hypothetical protein
LPETAACEVGRAWQTAPDSVIAFSFGRRSEPQVPSASNADLAREIVQRYPALPIVAQYEIASLIPPEMLRLCIGSGGSDRYLDTRGIALEALRCLEQGDLCRPVVVAHQSHLRRAVATCWRLGLDARVPEVELRVRFDRRSTQWWTRGPIRWWLRELPTMVYDRRPFHA